jgi:hypothetical protein
MADTLIQLEVEDWIRRNWMAQEYRQEFSPKRLRLSSGGVFEFDAVSEDGRIVANISTSGARTASGRLAVGKMLKIRSDMFFLLLADAERRLVILTELDVLELCQKEVESGRVPPSIEFVHAEIPPELARRLRNARRRASREVTPTPQG